MFIITAKEKKKDLSILDNMQFLSNIRKDLLNNPVAKEICTDNDVGDWFLEAVPISFSSLDVSAKTEDGNILLNEKLKNHPHKTQMRYVLHELVHALQHSLDKNKASDKEQDYLDRDDELEAFQYQLKFDKENLSKKDLNKYLKDLLDHHDVSDDDQDQKIIELMSKTKLS
jgi:hypothetical protein